VSRYRWISSQKAGGFPVAMACRVAEVSASASYDWLDRAAGGQSAAELARDEPLERIRKIHGDSGGNYGSPMVTAELRRQEAWRRQTTWRRFWGLRRALSANTWLRSSRPAWSPPFRTGAVPDGLPTATTVPT
jgi:hypothetical protein